MGVGLWLIRGGPRRIIENWIPTLRTANEKDSTVIHVIRYSSAKQIT
jgi:hypothetical protein